MQRIPMTPDGQKKLQEELKRLKSVERPKIVQEIEDARGHGDLSENAEYDAAKERQQQISRRIQELEHRLSLAQVIDPSTLDHEKVVFGATVTLHDIDNGEELSYTIVGAHESDISEGKISIESPIARALIGKEEGDEVKVRTPKGVREFEVVGIEYK
jgi:transcription elongation factor GreA